MKNILLYGVALLAASAAQAQSTNTSTFTFTTPQTMTAAGCVVSGVTTLTMNSDATITTNGTQTCTTNTCTPGTANCPINVTVTPSISGSPFTVGTSTAAPTISLTSAGGTLPAGVTCSLPNAATNGFTFVAGSNSFILSTPTAAQVSTTPYNFTVSCTSSVANTTVNVVPASVSLLVSQQVVSTGIIPCTSNQVASSTLGSKQLTRQCTGTATYSGGKFGQKTYTGSFNSLTDVLGGGAVVWPNYITGYSFTPTILSGSYISLGFIPTSSGSIQFTADPSYGDAGLISLSTTPGKFLPTDAGVLCAYGRGASNSLYINTTPGGYCAVTAGQVYYVNFADADYNGNSLCWPSNNNNSCTQSVVSYSEVVGK